jgi:hypothetical protein
MIAVITVLLAFPLGYRLKSHFAANTAYAIAYLWAFVYQTLYLVLDVMNDSQDRAFEPQEFPLSYGLVTAAIFGVGFGLVAWGHKVGTEHRARSAAPA